MKKKMNALMLLFLLSGAGQIGACLFLQSLGNMGKHILLCQIGFFGAFLCYCFSLGVLGRIEKYDAAQRQHLFKGKKVQGEFLSPATHFYFFLILVIAVCCRAILFFTPPALSDDIFRYVWEGNVFVSGFNPFAHAPLDPELVPLRDKTIFPNVAHAELAAIYPPVSQLIFALCAWLLPGVYTVKAVFVLFDLMTTGVLVLMLKHFSMPLTRVAVYALSPLVIIEFSGSGHCDSAGIFFLMLGLYLFCKGRHTAAAIMLSLSVLNKIFTALFLPLVVRRDARAWLFAGLVVIGLYLPFLDAGTKLFNSFFVYAEHWYFNSSGYDVLSWLLNDRLLARKICFVLFCAVFGFFVLQWRSAADRDERMTLRCMYCCIGAMLLLSPVVHPWYVCWIIPFLVFFQNRAWIIFTGAVFVSYWVLKDYLSIGQWHESVAVKCIEYIPLYGMLLWSFLRERFNAGRSEHPLTAQEEAA